MRINRRAVKRDWVGSLITFFIRTDEGYFLRTTLAIVFFVSIFTGLLKLVS